MDTEMRPNPGSEVNTDHLTEFYSLHGLAMRDTPSIRVLDLEAPRQNGSEDGARELRGCVRVVSLSDSPSFAALSYVWGPYSEPVDVISCNGYRIPITKNCRDALRHLQALFGPLTVWIDAICINQRDIREKSQQIELMGEIFMWAKTVYIWFGAGSPETDAAMEYLSSTPAYLACLIGTRWVSAPDWTWTFLREGVKAIGNTILLHARGHGIPFTSRKERIPENNPQQDLQDLLGREWRERVWTFQELILNCNPVIVCGTKCLDWDKFLCGIHRFHAGWRPGDTEIWIEGLPQLQYWQTMFQTWMYVERPTHWNGKEIRKAV